MLFHRPAQIIIWNGWPDVISYTKLETVGILNIQELTCWVPTAQQLCHFFCFPKSPPTTCLSCSIRKSNVHLLAMYCSSWLTQLKSENKYCQWWIFSQNACLKGVGGWQEVFQDPLAPHWLAMGLHIINDIVVILTEPVLKQIAGKQIFRLLVIVKYFHLVFFIKRQLWETIFPVNLILLCSVNLQ